MKLKLTECDENVYINTRQKKKKYKRNKQNVCAKRVLSKKIDFEPETLNASVQVLQSLIRQLENSFLN